MPSYHRSWRYEDERIVPARPESSQRDPEQLMDGREPTTRAFGVQRQQLLAESQVLEDKMLARAETGKDPTDQVPEGGDHGWIMARESYRTVSSTKLGSCALREC